MRRILTRVFIIPGSLATEGGPVRPRAGLAALIVLAAPLLLLSVGCDGGPSYQCPDCYGTGHSDALCPLCNPYDGRNTVFYRAKKGCMSCGGSGKLDCKTCDGRGRLPGTAPDAGDSFVGTSVGGTSDGGTFEGLDGPGGTSISGE